MIGFTQSSYPAFLQPSDEDYKNSFGFLIRVQKEGLIFQVSQYSCFLSLEKQQNMNIICHHITLLKVNTQPMKDSLSVFHCSNIGCQYTE